MQQQILGDAFFQLRIWKVAFEVDNFACYQIFFMQQLDTVSFS